MHVPSFSHLCIGNTIPIYVFLLEQIFPRNIRPEVDKQLHLYDLVRPSRSECQKWASTRFMLTCANVLAKYKQPMAYCGTSLKNVSALYKKVRKMEGKGGFRNTKFWRLRFWTRDLIRKVKQYPRIRNHYGSHLMVRTNKLKPVPRFIKIVD